MPRPDPPAAAPAATPGAAPPASAAAPAATPGAAPAASAAAPAATPGAAPAAAGAVPAAAAAAAAAAAGSAGAPAAPAAASAPRRRLVLVGNPNVGKSVIFGALTGTYVTVSNYPGTTVEITRGSAEVAGERWEVIDTPGVNNLVPMSEDEVVTRDLLLAEAPDAVVQVADAKNLRRGLLLALQLAELEVPFALNLNMVDEARSRGLNFRWLTLRERLGVPVNATVATERRGLKGLTDAAAGLLRRRAAAPSAAAPPAAAVRVAYPPEVEAAIARVAAVLPEAHLSRRGLAVMLLCGDESLGAWAAAQLAPTARDEVETARRDLAARVGGSVFAAINRSRLALCDELCAAVIIPEDDEGGAEAEAAPAASGASMAAAPPRRRTLTALLVAAVGTLGVTLAVDAALAALGAGGARPGADPLDGVALVAVLGRLFSTEVGRGWHPLALTLAPLLFAGTFLTVHRAFRPASGAARAIVSLAVAYLGFALLYALLWRRGLGAVALGAFALLLLAGLAVGALVPHRRNPELLRRAGALAMHRWAGVPILLAVLFLVYKLVGVFAAGTLVKLLEDDLFGRPVAAALIAVPDGRVQPVRGLTGGVQVTATPAAAGAVRVRLQERAAGGLTPHARPAAFYAGGGARVVSSRRVADGVYEVRVAGAGGVEVRTWTGHINRGLYRLCADHVPWAFVRDLVVGPYGILTMALTYAIAIVLPIVAMFFIVFSVMEDSGYLPRLAVMVNRLFKPLGLNGKAVLPMILGLGCDTMATLTTRILETRKERLLVTLLLALGIPCSAQLGVVLGMLAGVGPAAALWWLGAVAGTMLLVGFLAARVLPGAPSDFIMEIPPLRRPHLGNLLAKTGARISWYLREAVPLFILGTLILFTLDRLDALGAVQRAGEPVVMRWLGLPRETAEAFLIGFLRRDFAATKLYELATRGALDTVQVVVSMVTITLFIPCVANVIVIAKERGVGVAVALFAFIFPVAFLVGGLVNRLMRAWPGLAHGWGAVAAVTLFLSLVGAGLWLVGRLRPAAPRPRR
jgi:small GTP-binding protein